MTEHELEYLRERRAEADAGARERKAQATPAPWTYERDPYTGRDWALAWSANFVLTTESLHADQIGQEEADFRLMAASPDLYAACALAHAALDAATSTLAGLDPLPGSRLDELCGELAAAREACGVALGRAEGEGQ